MLMDAEELRTSTATVFKKQVMSMAHTSRIVFCAAFASADKAFGCGVLPIEPPISASIGSDDALSCSKLQMREGKLDMCGRHILKPFESSSTASAEDTTSECSCIMRVAVICFAVVSSIAWGSRRPTTVRTSTM